ncbi:MAG: threonine--tRNA ligase [Oscillospiraceae bacterium]|jgi:threonyl-tRNA synthetase|nr:threonine--tRNA ligase [Oscillospiraceae bacterium]
MQINITLKGGEIRQFEAGITVLDAARAISDGPARAACAAHIDGELADLRTTLNHDCALSILTFADADGQKTFRHTASHILAQAVKRLYPAAKLAIGPAIDGGFYYDFDTDTPLAQEDLRKIESVMKKIVKENLPIERFTLPSDEALTLMGGLDEPYKLELIAEHAGKGEDISFYKQGEFVDLCAGPHLLRTGAVKAFALTSCTGAYWRGDSKNRMLRRVYGTAFPKRDELEAHLAALEEAKKRDHNVIGRQLGYFLMSEPVGQGLAHLAPKGAKLFQVLSRYVEDLEDDEYGYVRTKTPYLAKSDLYKISGHWDHYKDGMFVLGDEEKGEEVFALRPMTCPFQYQIYLNSMHSYRDLPIRYGETSTLFRNEASGEMHGLIRLRQFTISEGHIILTPEQLEDEFRACLELMRRVMSDVGLLDDLTFRFSKWDPNNREKYEGTPEMWEAAENRMRAILDNLGVEYTEEVGEAAFYGPKLDIQTRNVYGKEDTAITIQIDMMLAEKFGMTYIDAEGSRQTPYIIHRTSIGCYERTMALLLEKYAGSLPLWLAPEQVRVLPITDRNHAFAESVLLQLRKAGLRAEIDRRSEKIGYKIREAQVEKVPYMLLIGDKESESDTVSVRKRSEGDLGAQSVQDFVAAALGDIDKKAIW